jgi:CRISPR/Cas system-associated exonuclease Cas4 (RecB family)
MAQVLDMASLQPRAVSSVWITWLAKALADPSTCGLPIWTQTRFKVLKEDDYTGDWAIKHSALIQRVQARLAAKGRSSEVEKEVSIASKSGLVITGSIDVWSPETDSSPAAVIDAKTGKYSPAHRIQVNLYQLITAQTESLTREGYPVGMLCYQGKDVWIKPEDVAGELIDQLSQLMEEVACDSQPEPRPSRSNCKYCALKHVCSASLQPASPPSPVSTSLF